MSDTTVCPTHGQTWKLVPAGVSAKTGVPYTAFWSCPERGCRLKPSDIGPRGGAQPAPASYPPHNVPQPNPTSQAAPEPQRPNLELLLGCMAFSARVWQGTAQADDAMICANSMYEAWKDVV